MLSIFDDSISNVHKFRLTRHLFPNYRKSVLSFLLMHRFYSKITALNISFVSLLINSVFAVEEKEYRNIPNLPARTFGTLQVTGFVQQNQNQTSFFPCLDVPINNGYKR